MTLSNVLIDINVCLDTVFDSLLFAAPAQEIAERSELGEFNAYVAAHSFDTMFYVLRKRAGGKNKAKKGIKDIRKAFGVAPVTEQIIDEAIAVAWNDFEDAIHHEAARAAGCQAIITRNKKDFKDADLLVFSPQEFLDELKGNAL